MSKTQARSKKAAGRTDSHQARRRQHVEMPSEVTEHIGWFDRFAQLSAKLASRAFFFSFCVLIVLLWVPTIFLMKFDTSQLLINTTTTIITFLMVALLQNSQTRSDQALQHKLNAIADGLADLMRHVDAKKQLEQDIKELREAVGLEERESTTKNRATSSRSSGARRSD
jgi:low affinity Fe/Cu permease